MDAEKWGNHYDRTLKNEGKEAALDSLARGMIREVKSRMNRAGRHASTQEIVEEVDEMWRSIAETRPRINPDGFEALLNHIVEESEPDIGVIG